jgi:hypothetical protein
MIIRRHKAAKGLTLIELMVTVLAAIVLIVAVVAILAEGHLGYRKLFRRVNSEVVRNSYEARRTFDRVVRKSSIRRCDLLNGNNEAYVYYFSNPQNLLTEDPDRYARFYLNGSQLWLEQGNVTGGFENPPPSLPALAATGGPELLARDVTPPAAGIFSVSGAGVRMAVLLDSETGAPPGVSKIETLKMTVTTTAIRHNW